MSHSVISFEVALRRNPRPRLRARDRLLWVWLSQLWPNGWRLHLLVVRPETVIRWHRTGWRRYWTWRSKTRLGRPRLSAETGQLIGEMSRDNPLWGSERIRGELLKLGIVVSNPLDPPLPVASALTRWQPALAHLPAQ